ncbi:MAG: hypothetical protein NVS3B25_26460 [Hymenobacter sp.]
MVLPDYLFYRFAALLFMGGINPCPERAAFSLSLLYSAVLSAAGLSLLSYVQGGLWYHDHLEARSIGSWLVFAVVSWFTYQRTGMLFPSWPPGGHTNGGG